MPHIFEWFRRGDGHDARGGTGIGLALVRHLVELHGGRVEASSQGKGRGARFTVWLPLQEAAPVGPVSAIAEPDVPKSKLDSVKILVIDDEVANADALRDLLELEGASVTVRTSGAEGVKTANELAFDAIICDIGMPDMNGYEVARALATSSRNASTPAIAYTGFSGPEDRKRASDAGFAAHLTKPVTLEGLVDTIQRAVRKAKAR